MATVVIRELNSVAILRFLHQNQDYGSHCEFWIISRSSIMVTFGQTSQGYFACMPDFRVGCHLCHLNDVFWNAEKLSALLGSVDGVTVASALRYLQKELGYPEF